MYSNSQNSVLANYMNFVSSSQDSIHELLSLIRQQETTFQNILTRPPPASSMHNNSIYYSNRGQHFNNRRTQTNFPYNTHSSGPYSYPSRNSIPSNLIFRNIQERILPRYANTTTDNQHPATMIQILRATDTKLFSDITDPVNTTCPITQEEFSENQEVIQIKNCQHNFKPDALLRWFHRNSTCPFCRYDIANYNNDISNNELDDSSEMDIENSTTPNNTAVLDSDSSAENMVQTISRLIGENIRDNLNNENEEFHYTIVGQRLQSPESRE